jgi:ABC-type branched-subunit amino acid transport system permease subunit
MKVGDNSRKLIALALIWAVLLLAPFWMPPLGGYTALGTRVLVLALAAMSVNFLLGFTGVLSFGHAAYFGLGAYGAGFALKFLAPSTPLSLLCGTLLGGVAGALLGALIVRRRGVYFAMVTIAFGQVFYYIAFQWSSLTGGDDGLRGFSRQPLDLCRHPVQHRCLLLFRALLLRGGGCGHGLHPGLAFRAHHDRHPRERKARALSRHSDRAPHLDRVHAVVLLHGVCRRALRAAQ